MPKSVNPNLDKLIAAAKKLVSAPVKLDATPTTKPAANGAELLSADMKLTCRTDQPIDFGGFRLAHDFSSFKPLAETPCDYGHDDSKILGVCRDYRIEGGDIVCEAAIESLSAGDDADMVIRRMSSEKAPVPFQSSAFWEGTVTYLDHGSQTVNGVEVQAPALIVTDWTIRQMAICPNGADSGTATKLLAKLSAAVIAAESGEEEPPPPNDTIESVPPQETPSGETSSPQPPPAEIEAAPTALSRAELKRFSDRFGAEALAYLTADLNYGEALEQHVEKLAKELSAANAKIADLEKKLAKPPTMPNRGEPHALSATPEAPVDDRFAHLGRLAAAARSDRFMPK